MRKSISLVFAFAIILSVSAFAQDKKDVKMTSIKDSISYIIGYDIGQNFNKQGIEVSSEVMMRGILDGLKLSDSKIPLGVSEKILQAYVAELQAKKTAKTSEDITKIKKEGQDFLAANKKNAGVVETSSGLQYKVIREGTGTNPKLTDKVMVHYSGKLINGTEFDNSYKRGEPISFPLNGVIKGWQEGVQLMKEGAKYELYIPSDLGYGDTGAGESIPGGSVLIFEVELIKVITE